jgi:hypothetical protein
MINNKVKMVIFNLAIVLFEQVLTGSSLNPDKQEYNDVEMQSDNRHIYQMDYNDYIDEDDCEDYEDERDVDQDIDQEYTGYKFENTVEKLFKTKKVKKDIGEADPRRFEDADM